MTADDRNPVTRALDDASSGPEARAYSVPVDLVRRRAARRHAARTTGTAAVAVAVVGGLAVGIPSGLAALRDGEPPPPMGDWPAQFDRCGEPMGSGVQLVLPDVPPAADSPPGATATLAISDGTTTMPADGEWSATLTLGGSALDGDRQGWVWGTDLTVFDDSNVVVGVQGGVQVPDVDGIDEWLGGQAPSFPLGAFPLVTDLSLGIAACDQYPAGQGSPDLAPGDYYLMVTQTASYLDDDGARHDLRRSRTALLTITEPGSTPADDPAAGDPAACGASDDELTRLADPEANPQAFGVDAVFGDDALVGLPLAGTVAFTPAPGSEHGFSSPYSVGDARAVLTRDGIVVGDSAPSSLGVEGGTTGGSAGLFEGGVPQDCAARAAAKAEPEDGFPLGAGDYELWLVLDRLSGDEPLPDSLMAAGPWPLTLHSHPTPLEPIVVEPVDGGPPFGCGYRFADRIDPAWAGSGVALEVRSLVGPQGSSRPVATAAVVSTDGRAHLVSGTSLQLAVLDADGRIAGFARADEQAGDEWREVTPDAPLDLTVDVWALPVDGCSTDFREPWRYENEVYQAPFTLQPYAWAWVRDAELGTPTLPAPDPDSYQHEWSEQDDGRGPMVVLVGQPQPLVG